MASQWGVQEQINTTISECKATNGYATTSSGTASIITCMESDMMNIPQFIDQPDGEENVIFVDNTGLLDSEHSENSSLKDEVTLPVITGFRSLKKSSNEKAEVRKSQRGRQKKRAYSPELSPSKRKRKKPTKYPVSRLNTIRAYDIGPDGRPFCCDICKSPYVCNPSKRGPRLKVSKHKPSPRHKLDPDTGKLLVLCNACGLAFDKPCKLKKDKVQPNPEEKKKYIDEAKTFGLSLVQGLKDPDAERLACPHFKAKPCGCLQKYIIGDGDMAESKKRAHELLQILKSAKKLSSEKCYDVEQLRAEGKPKGSKSLKIGLGNGQRRSKKFEEFVLTKRKFLRDDLKLCERACQRVLMYSNNFLHKKLKTDERGTRAERVKGKAALGLLEPIPELYKTRCCIDNCVMMSVTHGKLLELWRDRVKKGQTEARRVLAEMLTPTGGARSNCYKFISMVTGCSSCTIGSVNEQMRLTGGIREPPEHGLKKYWQEKERVREVKKDKQKELVIENPKKTLISISEPSQVISHLVYPIQPGLRLLPEHVTLDTYTTGEKDTQANAKIIGLENVLQDNQNELLQHQLQQQITLQQLIQPVDTEADASDSLNQDQFLGSNLLVEMTGDGFSKDPPEITTEQLQANLGSERESVNPSASILLQTDLTDSLTETENSVKTDLSVGLNQRDILLSDTTNQETSDLQLEGENQKKILSVSDNMTKQGKQLDSALIQSFTTRMMQYGENQTQSEEMIGGQSQGEKDGSSLIENTPNMTQNDDNTSSLDVININSFLQGHHPEGDELNKTVSSNETITSGQIFLQERAAKNTKNKNVTKKRSRKNKGQTYVQQIDLSHLIQSTNNVTMNISPSQVSSILSQLSECSTTVAPNVNIALIQQQQHPAVQESQSEMTSANAEQVLAQLFSGQSNGNCTVVTIQDQDGNTIGTTNIQDASIQDANLSQNEEPSLNCGLDLDKQETSELDNEVMEIFNQHLSKK